MTLENDPKVKTQPSQRMRKQLAALALKQNMKLAAKKEGAGA